MEYLISLGHRRIGFIGGRPDLLCAQQRLHGYEEALRQATSRIRIWSRSATFSRDGPRLCSRLLSLADPPTAIFAANDQSAIGAIEAAACDGPTCSLMTCR